MYRNQVHYQNREHQRQGLTMGMSRRKSRLYTSLLKINFIGTRENLNSKFIVLCNGMMITCDVLGIFKDEKVLQLEQRVNKKW